MNRRLALAVLCAVWLVRCGVEAGNPHPTKPTTGSIQIFFTQTPRQAKESLELKLAGLELLSGEGDDATAATLTAATNSVDLYSVIDTDEVLAARGDEVPSGTYDKLVVTLAEDGPATYRESPDGAAIPIPFATEGARSIRIAETVEITEGGETKILVSLDPKRSVIPKEGKPDTKVLRPVGGAHQKDRNRSHEGMTTELNAAWVCAYLYGKAPLPPPPPPKRPEGSHSQDRPPPPPGVDAQNRPAFTDASQVVKDTVAECPNAFERVPVVSGRYVFRHLPPASFDFRLFRADGTYVDLPSAVKALRP